MRKYHKTSRRGLAIAAVAVALATFLCGCRCVRTQDMAMAQPIVWECGRDGLDPLLLDAIERVAQAYAGRTGRQLTITSGRRTLRHQAELMAGMSRAQLEGLYCRHGYPGYIRDLVTFREEHGTLTAEDAYRILRERSEGYISTHLFGAAVDIAAEGTRTRLLKRLLAAQGFRVLDERNLGIACIHATYQAVPTRIVRE